ncbi:AraC family transcriptional regulator [Marinobacter halophilus]|uniref:AraC family transcriptional regulator n=1 Tax=Marinobacter halophilus TaxID=1323740 RepID=A0A2T1KBU0_9GAMM|nr:AraC family transcriptional regulator [Marinobacter halophilus]PSF07520.1 AraC family transcriptional regulator [Marinobacter halophilus]GGC80214.1 AraC family transcriptional regulator [Marinobacter halophilus]
MDTLNNLALEVPILSARYALRFVQFMESRGVKRHTILEKTGVTEDMLNNPEGSLSMTQVLTVLGKADWLMTDERAAFEFGQQLDLPSHGLLGFAVLGQENPRRLVSMIVQYLRVGLPLMDMELASIGSTFRIRLVDTWGLGSLLPCLTKIYMGSIYRVSSQVCSHFTFQFDFPTTTSEQDWKRLAPDSEFEFNAEVSQVMMPLTGIPIRQDDVSLEFLVARTRHDRKQNALEADETALQVRELVMSQPGRPCTTENIARRLDISPRTLRQHLASAGTSFRELRNEIRENFATLYLKDTNVPLESISEKLGFSDQAGFTKAYRSWTGMTPGDVRRQARQKK